MSIDRKRLRPDESRDRALEAARQILLDEGPQAVTLKAVASRIGRTHANILHHFGSARAVAAPSPEAPPTTSAPGPSIRIEAEP